MLSLLRNKLLFTLIFLFLTLCSFSQLNYRDGHPFNVMLKQKQTSLAERDSLLNFFIQESHGHFKFYFENVSGAKKEVLMENLFPILKDNIESFIKGYSKDSLQDIEPTKRMWVKPIYEKIQILKVKNSKSENEIREVSNLITPLPNTKEKVWLLLQYSTLNMPLLALQKDVITASLDIQSKADIITDLYERGEAYIYIGDFAAEHQTKNLAILMYYLAKENFYNCDRDSAAKYNAQGIVCEKIASLFPNERFISGIKKRINYYESAGTYFAMAKNVAKAHLNHSIELNYSSYLLANLRHLDHDTILHHQEEGRILKDLSRCYGITTLERHDFLAFTSIATILMGESKYEAALPYYLVALLQAHKNMNVDDIYAGLFNASFAYSFLGKEKQAICFANLAIALAEKLNDRVMYYRALHEKASDFYILKKYDSALVYVNKSIHTVRLRSIFDHVPHVLTRELSCDLKFFIYRDIKSDSCWFYRNWATELQSTRSFEFESLLQAESDAIMGWLERVKDKEVDTEKKSKEIAEANKKEVQALNEKISNRNLKLLYASIGLAGLSIGMFGIYVKYRKKSKEVLKYSTSDLKLRSAIQNHNLASHYSKIKEMIREGRAEEAGNYCEATCTYFGEFYKTILEKTTLQKELDILNLFVKTDNIYKNRNIVLSQPVNIDNHKTTFLSDVFVPLYENALVKGFGDHSKEYHFTIEIHHSDSLLHCRIYDNGDGIENIDSVIRDKSYLDMLRNRIENYFKVKKVALPKCNVFEINSAVNKGTEIKFIMPYEII